jgi:murein DD-endopeptidase MepM/ murein hydrolase activator NlpD
MLPSLVWRRWFVTIALVALAAIPFLAHDREKAAFKTISWMPHELANGSPCLFTVEMENVPSSLTGKWQGHSISFSAGEDRHIWYALAGVDVEAHPGDYKLELSAAYPGSKVVEWSQIVKVQTAPYKTQSLRVPQNYVEPDPESLRKINLDKEIKKKAFAHEEPTPLWSGDFQAPVTSSVSETFGTRRTFNGKLASIHRGLDYHAKPGTPVHAANSGEVVLARELFYEGNCVIVDHGQQFMTIYMHLSQLQVQEGQKVEKGQTVGLSGATGRATGPHLHVTVRWQGESLDPAQLWTLPLPVHP